MRQLHYSCNSHQPFNALGIEPWAFSPKPDTRMLTLKAALSSRYFRDDANVPLPALILMGKPLVARDYFK